jgi:NDP-sugar pyrophosphorylase family protein
MLNIVIPMAGAGSRFSTARYALPKPLIPVNGVPMIQAVINNLRPAQNHRFIFICQNEHIENYGLIDRLHEWSPGSIIIGIDGLTEGAACTVLKAKDYINSEDPLMIANSDQYIDANINDYLDRIKSKNLAGLIMTMKASDPKWSFVGLNEGQIVVRVVEKEVISDEATVGIYNFSQGSDFVKAAELMIHKNLRVNNEFYVAPVYNELISNGYRIGIFNIGKEADGMYGLGTPSDLDLFMTLPVHRKIGQSL